VTIVDGGFGLEKKLYGENRLKEDKMLKEVTVENKNMARMERQQKNVELFIPFY
jgi:hypothetical protein